MSSQLRASTNVPSLHRHRILTKISRIRCENMVISRSMPTSNSLRRITRPNSSILPTHGCITMPNAGIRTLIRTTLSRTTLRHLRILHQPLTILLRRRSSVTLTQRRLNRRQMHHHRSILLRLTATTLPITQNLITLRRLRIRHRVSRTNAIHLKCRRTDVNMTILTMTRRTIRVIRPLRRLVIMNSTTNSVKIPNRRFRALLINMLNSHLVVIT